MYKIYINEVPVFLCTNAENIQMGYIQDHNTFVMPYWGKRKQIKQYLDLLDHRKGVKAVVLHSDELEALWQDFKDCFSIQEAAGGVVYNQNDELLVFLRRGSWDLPKGKIDPGETPEMAALREVREETGLGQLDLGPFLMHTYHTFMQKGKRILKITWWYKMRTSDTAVTPQVEEDIEKIEWVEPRAWLAGNPVVYGNIRELILNFQ